MSDTHETLAAKQMITEVLYRYCHTVDRNDGPGIRSVWHPDGLADYEGFSTGTADEFVDRVLTSHSYASALSHQLTNILIDVDVASDRATSVSYVTALVRVPGTDHVARTQYHDSWSRRDGVWAIDTRRVLLPIVQVIPNDVEPS
ncbi:MAG: nuclear transport factor 2 family protein [Acidimicrobiia bacterium]